MTLVACVICFLSTKLNNWMHIHQDWEFHNTTVGCMYMDKDTSSMDVEWSQTSLQIYFSSSFKTDRIMIFFLISHTMKLSIQSVKTT